MKYLLFYLLTCLSVIVSYVLLKVWQVNGSKGRLMVASKEVPLHSTYGFLSQAYTSGFLMGRVVALKQGFSKF
jgi:hypothetical protein